MSDLTAKQQAFIEAYLACGFNAAEAARQAGYSGKTARQQGQRLLTNVDIAAAVRQGLAERAMPADEVLARLAEQARGTMLDFLDESGDIDLKQARERGQLHLIKARSVTKDGERIELYSAQSALELLAKHHALLTEKIELSGETAVKVYAGFDPDNV
jgi:phage terminase small subunit